MIQTTLVLLFNEKNQLLLWSKRRWFGQWRWNGFGGKFDAKEETPLQAATRELQEETSIVYPAHQLEQIGHIQFIWPDKERPCFVFSWSYTGEFSDSDEMVAIQWFDKNNLPYEQMREADKIMFPLFFEKNEFISLAVYYDENNKLVRWKKK